MFWQKVQHHFLFIFLAFVLLAQSLIFVVSQAVPFKNYELKADWLSPQNGQTLFIDQSIDLQAKFETGDKKIGAIYFVISDASKNFVINFESQKNNENVYTSLLAWNASDWPSGIYSLNARASIIDAQGQVIDEQESNPIWVKLISAEEYAGIVENFNPSAISDSALNVPSLGDDNVLPIDFKEDIIVDINNTPTSSPTSTTSNNSTSTSDILPDLTLVSPINNIIIIDKDILVSFSTNFSADDVGVEFINTDNAAISTGELALEKTDGLQWVKNIELGDTFINGSYKLLISVAVPGSNLSLNKSFDYDLSVPSQIKVEDLFMDLINLSSNVDGEVGLRAEANLRINNLDFVIEDSITHVEALRIKGINNSIASTTGAKFLAIWDTAVLSNGNYLVFVESKIEQQKVGSVKQLVTVFNSKNNNQSSSTPSFVEPQAGPNIGTSPTSTVSVVNSLASNAVSSIDCERSGITDQNMCQRYQAELNDSLPLICLDKNIFVAGDCEKYIFDNENKICSDQKIADSVKCREYLYKKYSPGLVCNISATSTCQQLISDQYIARLAYLLEQKNKYLNSIDNFNSTDLSLNSLNDKLRASDITNPGLALIASDKKILTLRLKNKSVLDFAENLLVASPFAIMSDSDNDALPDDLEIYYGTNLNKADTDADGYDDGREILNNFNPLGEGELSLERASLDQVLLGKIPLEEPKTSTLLADSNWQVMATNSVGGSMNFSGKALANTWVNIFIYSAVPFLATTKTDTNGNWSYSLSDPLSEGLHQVYIASNDKNGKLLAQSAAVTFLVANIKNESAPIGVGQQVNVISEKNIASNQNMYYIIGGVFLLLILLGVALFIIKRRRARPDNLVAQAINNTPVSAPLTKIQATTEPKETVLNLPETPPQASAEESPVAVENKD